MITMNERVPAASRNPLFGSAVPCGNSQGQVVVSKVLQV